MANEINWRHTATGSTLYATVELLSDATIWNGSALVAMVVADWANYDIALSESPVAGYRYIGNMPAVAAGRYRVRVWLQAGGVPAITDTKLGEQDIDWTGTVQLTAASQTSVDTLLYNTIGRWLEVSATTPAGAENGLLAMDDGQGTGNGAVALLGDDAYRTYDYTGLSGSLPFPMHGYGISKTNNPLAKKFLLFNGISGALVDYTNKVTKWNIETIVADGVLAVPVAVSAAFENTIDNVLYDANNDIAYVTYQDTDNHYHLAKLSASLVVLADYEFAANINDVKIPCLDSTGANIFVPTRTANPDKYVVVYRLTTDSLSLAGSIDLSAIDADRRNCTSITYFQDRVVAQTDGRYVKLFIIIPKTMTLEQTVVLPDKFIELNNGPLLVTEKFVYVFLRRVYQDNDGYVSVAIIDEKFNVRTVHENPLVGIPNPSYLEIGYSGTGAGGGYNAYIVMADWSTGAIYAYSPPGSLQHNLTELSDVHDEAFGKWVINTENRTLTEYKRDGVTILKQFNLTEAAGMVPAYIERAPV